VSATIGAILVADDLNEILELIRVVNLPK